MNKYEIQACENLRFIRNKYNYSISEFSIILGIKWLLLVQIEKKLMKIPDIVYDNVETKFKISRARLLFQDLKNSDYNKHFLVAHLKNGELIPFYDGDFSSLASIDKECNKLRNMYGDGLDYIEFIMDEMFNTYEIQNNIKTNEISMSKDAKKFVLEYLDDNLDNERVQNELMMLSEKNYIDIVFMKKIADFLKDNNEYYLLRGNYANLYISYLLGITSINPLDEKNPLPYKLLFMSKNKSFNYDLNVSIGIKEELIKYIKQLSENKCITVSLNGDKSNLLSYKYLIPLKDDICLSDDYRELNHDDYIEINIHGCSFLDEINKQIKKYGLPNFDIKNDERINSEIFDNQNIIGITGTNEEALIKLLKRCDNTVRGFDTYVYLTAGLHGTNVISQIGDIPIEFGTIRNFPTSREKLYQLLIKYRLSEDDALFVCDFAWHNVKYRLNRFEKYYQIMKDLPESFVSYVNNIAYIFPLAHCITYAELNYLEMYYKIYAPRLKENIF